MLPGFRFLFAATLLTLSLVVFGFGAVALLRASHQQVANLPTRPPPEPVFAQRPETAPPTLALLRFDPPTPEQAPPTLTEPASETMALLTTTARPEETSSVSSVDITEPSQAAASPQAKIDPIPAAALDQGPVDQPTPTAADSGRLEPAVPVPTQAETPALPAAPAPQQLAATDITGSTPAPGDSLSSTPAIVNPPLPVERPNSAGKIAKVDGSATEVEAVKPVVKPAIAGKKQARRVARKRRVVARPRAVRPAAPAAASPFGSPLGT